MAGGEEAMERAGSYSLASLMEEEAQEGSYHPSFQCCVCLDLLFKPVVLACGHMSCFWCVHKAMHGLRASYCPICRQPYIHFPSICELLHILVLKMEPVAYKRREKEVLEEERRLDVFSPQFKSLPCEDVCSDCNGSSDLRNVGDSFDNQGNIGSNISKQAILQKNGSKNNILMDIFKDDVLCAMCEELLFQPTVLNCGHVFCESCLASMGSEALKCHICQSIHPGEFPKICLDLDRFLEEQFPNEYTTRRERLQQLKKLNDQCGGTSVMPSVSQEEQNKKSSKKCKDSLLWLDEHLSNINVGVGCDSCGMYPIIGKRYKCKDCKEAVGFDLCESCYSTTSKLPGRFNQQHTPDHRFELDDSHMLYKILLLSSSMEDPYQNLSDEPDPNGSISAGNDSNVEINRHHSDNDSS